MGSSIFLLSFAVLLTLVSGRTYFPNYLEEDTNYLVLLDNQEQINPNEIERVHVSENDVSFHYKSRLTYSFELSLSSMDYIFSTDFDPTRRTMFVIHGWNNDRESTVNQVIPEALLAAEEWNVFVVDWGSKAKGTYTRAVGSIAGVADVVASFIEGLMERTGMDLDKVNMCGHSLGAHVCGKVGHLLQGEVETIVGMDPAFPLIDGSDDDKHLDPSDAKYVQIIHTNAGQLAFKKALGHSDFYPNGGSKQNGCVLDIFGNCAHSRSYLYFAESILNDNFKSVYCESKTEWQKGECSHNEIGYMGGNKLDRVYGTFYLATEKSSPFALGDETYIEKNDLY